MNEIIIKIVDVEELNIKLYKIFVNQLTELSIGYSFNKNSLKEMMNILGAMHYIKYGNISEDEIYKIINIYG